MTRPIYGNDRGKRRRRLNDEFVYVTFKFPKKYPLWMILEALYREGDEIMSYLKTRKEETLWNQQ